MLGAEHPEHEEVLPLAPESIFESPALTKTLGSRNAAIAAGERINRAGECASVCANFDHVGHPTVFNDSPAKTLRQNGSIPFTISSTFSLAQELV